MNKRFKEMNMDASHISDSDFIGYVDRSLRGGKLELYYIPLYFAMYCLSQKEHRLDNGSSIDDISFGLDTIEEVLRKYEDSYVLYGESIVDEIVDCFSFILKDVASLVDEGEIFRLENISDNPELYSILHTQGEHSNKLNELLKYNQDLVLQGGSTGGQKSWMGVAVKIKKLMNSKKESKKITLKSYLEKKLTISPKEAHLIESVIREYIQKKRK